MASETIFSCHRRWGREADRLGTRLVSTSEFEAVESSRAEVGPETSVDKLLSILGGTFVAVADDVKVLS